MKTLLKTLVLCLAVLFSIGIIPIASNWSTDQPLIIVIDLSIPLAFWLWFFKLNGGISPNGGSKQRVTTMAAAAEEWIAGIRSGGSVPAPNVGSVMVPAGEKAILGCEGTLSELTSDGARAYMGTRMKLGSMPIYVGRSKRSGGKSFHQADRGNFVVTDKNAYFVGLRKTLSIKLVDIIAIHPTLDELVINIKNRAAPVAITTPNPILWTTVIQSLANGTLSLPKTA